MLCEEFDKLTNTSLRGQHSTDPFPWLAKDDERRNLTDVEEICEFGDIMLNPESKGRDNGYAI